MNGGRCVYNNTCQCPPHWTGEHCEQSLLSTTYSNTHTDRTSYIINSTTSPVSNTHTDRTSYIINSTTSPVTGPNEGTCISCGNYSSIRIM